MKTTHIMLDIETVSKTNTAAILSIGAVAFDPNDPNTNADQGDKFHVRCDLNGQERWLTIDGDTVQWWLAAERDAARAQLLSMVPVDFTSALFGFAAWLDSQLGETVAIWGNGATFDNVIVLNAFRELGVPHSKWTYKSDRCYRTMKSIAGIPDPVDYGTTHSALDDAIAQANHLKAIVAHLGITL